MEGIRIKVGSRTLLFATTGDVAEVVGAETKVKGTWRSESAEKDNQIRFTLDGADQAPLPAIYSFNSTNQLVMRLKSGSTTSGGFALMGRIEVDRNHNLIYSLVDTNGEDTGFAVTVYGSFGFAKKSNNLIITPAGGAGTAEIRGESGVQSLEHHRNPSVAFDADDLLDFQAVTRNPVPGEEDPVAIPAKLQFVGNWDIANGTVVFASKISGSPDKSAVQIGFAGKFGAVTGGLVYYADDTMKKVALNVRGRHTFANSRGAKTDFEWETTLGYSEKKFEAKLKSKSHTVNAHGQTLDIMGELSLRKEGSTPLTMDLTLSAEYRWNESNMLVFTAKIATGSQPSYDLNLAGTFKYSNLSLQFQVNYSSSPSARSIVVSVGLQGDRNSMLQNISALFEITETEAKAKINIEFEAKIVFLNGKRVKELPEQAAAPEA
jgi:hypothetical protein